MAQQTTGGPTMGSCMPYVGYYSLTPTLLEYEGVGDRAYISSTWGEQVTFSSNYPFIAWVGAGTAENLPSAWQRSDSSLIVGSGTNTVTLVFVPTTQPTTSIISIEWPCLDGQGGGTFSAPQQNIYTTPTPQGEGTTTVTTIELCPVGPVSGFVVVPPTCRISGDVTSRSGNQTFQFFDEGPGSGTTGVLVVSDGREFFAEWGATVHSSSQSEQDILALMFEHGCEGGCASVSKYYLPNSTPETVTAP